MSDWPLDRTYSFNGQKVRYAIQGDGPPLVFVHGTPFSSYVWHRIAPHFSASHRVHYFDLLGYGQSEQAAGQDVSLGVQNRLLAELLEHWGLERPDVVAHDFGGATALRAHLLNGKDYRSLTLLDPVALSPWGSPFVQHVRQHEQAFSSVPDYIQRAIVPAYIRGRSSARSPTGNWRPTSSPGSAPAARPRSTGRSRRWTSAIPRRWPGFIPAFAARPRFSGARTISGSPSNAGASCTG